MFVFMAPQGELELDACRVCQIIWFDPQELESIPDAVARPLKVPVMSEALGAELAGEHMNRSELRASHGIARDIGDSNIGWRSLPAMLNMPVSTEGVEDSESVPWISRILSLAIIVVGFWTVAELPKVIANHGLIPKKLFRNGGTTFLTSFFLHDNFIVFAESAYFLILFGDAVENFLGRFRYAVLLVSATVFGGLVHVWFTGDHAIPYVGASGGIAGLVSFFILRFPHATLWFRFAHRDSDVSIGKTRWYSMPVWGWVLLWVLGLGLGNIDLLRDFIHTKAETSFSMLPIIGGGMVGLLFWLFFDLLDLE